MGQWDEQVPGGAKLPGGMSPETLQLLVSLFGKPSAVPQAEGSGANVASKVVTGPPTVAGPPPTGGPQASGGYNPQGAAVQMPNAPQPAPSPGAVAPMGGQMEFNTGAGRSGAVTSSAIGGVFEALHNATQKQHQDKVQHAQFLYDMLKTAQANGDQATVAAITNNPKSVKMIEKYLTGELPRPQGALTDKKGKAQGPPLMPQPSQAQRNVASADNTRAQAMKENNPAMKEAILGEGGSMSKADQEAAIKGKYGIELTPVQVKMMSQTASLTLEGYKTDIFKSMMQKQEDYKRAMAVAELDTKARSSDVDKTVKGRTRDTQIEAGSRMATAKMIRESIESEGKLHRASMEKIKLAPPDKMDQVIFQETSKMYKSEEEHYLKYAADMEKAGKVDLAKDARAQADIAAKKGEEAGQNYHDTKVANKLLEGIEFKKAETEVDDEK